MNKKKTEEQFLLDESVYFLERLIKQLPYFECENFHHAKYDQHLLFEPCPPKERLEKTISDAKFLIRTIKEHRKCEKTPKEKK